MPKPLNTELTRLRKAAPGSITQAGVVDYLKRHRLKVAVVTVGDFERGKYLPANPRFITLYAKAIGRSRAAVLKAWGATKGTRKRTG